MKRFTKKIMTALLALCLLGAYALPASARLQVNDSVFTDTDLQFDTATGKFVIMQVADIRAGEKPETLLIDMLERAVETIKPGLVVFTGNLVDLSFFDKQYSVPKFDKVRDSLGQIFDVLDHRGIPFAVTFGQTEFSSEVTKQGLVIFCQTYNGCIIQEDDKDAPGVNYYKTIYGDGGVKNAYNLWFMDSLCKEDLNKDIKQVGISEKQVEWYQNSSNALKAKNGKKPLKSIVFMNDSTPKNSDFFKAAVKQGDVQAMFFANSEVSKAEKYSGIERYTTAGIGFNVKNQGRGVRIITIDNKGGEPKCTSEVKTFSDIFDINVIAYIRYFYTACETIVFAWILTGLIVAGLITLITLAIIRRRKNIKNIRLEERGKKGKNHEKRTHKSKKRKGKSK